MLASFKRSALLLAILALVNLVHTQTHAAPSATLENAALALNVDGGVEVPHHDELNPTEAITIEAWVWRDNASACETVVGKNFHESYWLGFCSGAIRFYPSGGSIEDGTTSIPAHTWTHVAVTYDGATVRYYINGQPDGTDANASGLATNDSPLGIGTDPETGYDFDGFIDEVRIWDRVRTQADIQSNMRAQISSGAGLVAYWRLNGNAEDSAWAGHASNGTLTGSAAYTPRGVLPNDTALSFNSAPVSVDGSCSPAEYNLGWLEVSGFATVYMQHDDSDAYICFAGLERLAGNAATVLFDTDNSQSDPAGSGDYRFSIDIDGNTVAQEGNGSGGFNTFTPPAGAWEAAHAIQDEFTWNAEFRFDRDLLQQPAGWAETLGLALVEERNANPDYSWPGAVVQSAPSTWGHAYASTASGSTRTYNIEGYVIDEQSGDGIANSSIQLFGSGAFGTYLLDTATTGSDGAFNFSYVTGLPTNFLLQAQDASGYSSVSATAGDDGAVISPNVVRLDSFNGNHTYSIVTFLDAVGRPAPRTFDKHYLIVYSSPVTYSDLWPLIEMKRLQGFQVEAETVQNIEASTAGYDRAEKIRNWLRGRWHTYDPEPIYAILIGDTDVIPERQVGWEGDYAHRDPETSPAYVTDWYYADLDSDDWDADGDGYYGEFLYCAPNEFKVPIEGADLPGQCPPAGSPLREGGYGASSEPDDDWIAEIAIGRLMLNDRAAVRLALETMAQTEASGDLAKRDALLAGAMWYFYGNSWDAGTATYKVGEGPQLNGSWPSDGNQPFGDDAAIQLETMVRPEVDVYLDNFTTLYEGMSPGDDPDLIPTAQTFDEALSADNLEDALDTHDFGLVNATGHGNSAGVYHGSWVRDYNDNGRIENPVRPSDAEGCDENCRELTGDRLFLGFSNVPDPQSIAPVYFANACSTGEWTEGANTIPSRLFAEGRAAAWMGALNVVPVHGVDAFQRDFNRDIVTGPVLLGDAAWGANGTRHRTRWVYDWRMGTLQLFGDPAYSYWGNPADAIAPWPQLGNDWWATGYGLDDGPAVGTLGWTRATYSPQSPPVVDRRSNILVGAQGRLLKVNPLGFIVDSAQPGVIITHAPAVTTDGVYAVAGPAMYIYDRDLNLRDQFGLGGSATGAPRVGPDGTVWVPTTLGMARITGAGLPDILAGGAATSPVAFTPSGGVVWATGDGLVAWFMSRDGMSVSAPEPIPGVSLGMPAVGEDGTVFAGGDNGRLYALPFPFSDPIRWTYNAGSAIVGKPAVGPDGTVYFGTANGRVYAVDHDGHLLWQRQAGGSIAAGPALDSHHLYVPSGNSLYALQLGSGEILWSVDLGGSTGSDSTPAIANGAVYVTRSDGVLAAVTADRFVISPSDVTASPLPGVAGTLTVNWSDNSDNETGFNLELCDLTGTCGTWLTVGPNTTEATLPQIPGSANLYVRIQAVGQLGGSTAPAFTSEYAYSDVTSVLPPAPQAPGSLAATAVSSTEIGLTWQYTGGDAGLLTGFNVYRSDSAGGPYSLVGSTDGGTTSYDDGGLAANTAHYYRVRAVNDAGESTNSNTASATTKAITLPTPTNLTVRQRDDNSVRLTWTDNTNAETNYIVLQQLEGEAGFKRLAQLAANSTGYTIPYYLVADGRLTYEVKAINVTAESQPAISVYDYVTPAEYGQLLPFIAH